LHIAKPRDIRSDNLLDPYLLGYSVQLNPKILDVEAS
jgi:hypothetical protein